MKIKAIRNMRKFHISSKHIPLVFILTGLLAFGPMIPWLGIYWDDWPSLWFLKTFGPSVFPKVFTIDRPLLGYLFVLTTSLVGKSMIAWQLFGILTHVLSGISFWWMLRVLWPDKTYQVTWMTVLFLVYPGFTHHYIPITYSQISIILTLSFLSLGIMMLANRGHRRFWLLMAFSVVIAGLSMSVYEYFVGLELLRPVLLWMTLDPLVRNKSQKLRLVALRWLPYLAILCLFILWKVSHTTPRASIVIFEQLRAEPLIALSGLLKTILNDLFQSSVIAWGQVFNLARAASMKWYAIALFAVVFILATLVSMVFLWRLRLDDSDPEKRVVSKDQRWAVTCILLGAFAMLVGGWPVWVTDLHIDLYFPWERFTLLMMTGVTLLLAGFIELVARCRWQTVVIVGLLTGMAAGWHFQVAVSYRQDWTLQREFFNQLTWRIPGLKSGTTLVAPELPFSYVTDNSLTAPLNWIYAPDNHSFDLSYLMLNIDARQGRTLTEFSPETPIQLSYRGMKFNGSTSQVLVFVYDPPGCLKVFDPAADKNWPNKPDLLYSDALDISNPNLIEVNPQQKIQLPAEISGEEAKKSWCYYFENADLAMQAGEWENIIGMAEKAIQLNYPLSKSTASELTPFIVGYLNTGQWLRAAELSLEADRLSSKMKYMLCPIWNQAVQGEVTITTEEQAQIEKVLNSLNCGSLR